MAVIDGSKDLPVSVAGKADFALLLCSPTPCSRFQGGGVFCNPISPTAPAKLRCLYENYPLALITEAAGGSSLDGGSSGAKDSGFVVAF